MRMEGKWHKLKPFPSYDLRLSLPESLYENMVHLFFFAFQGYDYAYYDNLQNAYVEAPCLNNSTHLTNATTSANSTFGEGFVAQP